MIEVVHAIPGRVRVKVLVLLGVRGLFLAEELPAPRWYDLLWFGFGTFVMLNAAGIPPARAAEEAAEIAAAL